MFRAVVLSMLVVSACGGKDSKPVDDAGTDDARPADAAVDAPGGTTSNIVDLSAASGRVTGPTYTLEVQLGQPTGEASLQGDIYQLEPATAVKP